MDQAPNPLADLADAEVERLTRQHFDAMTRAEHRGLLEAKQAGDYFREKRRRLEHGQWLKWLKAEYPKSEDTARQCMSFSEHWHLVEPHLREQPTLSKRAAERLIREALSPPPKPPLRPVSLARPPVFDAGHRVVFGPAGPLSADQTIDALGERARADLARALSREIRCWHPETALVLAEWTPSWAAVLNGLRYHLNHLRPLARVFCTLLRRLYREKRGEYQFGHDLALEGGRQVSEEDFDDDLAWAVARVHHPPSQLERELIAAFLASPAGEQLRPVERNLLEGIVADAPAADEEARERRRLALDELHAFLDEWVERVKNPNLVVFAGLCREWLAHLDNASLVEMAFDPMARFKGMLDLLRVPDQSAGGGIEYVLSHQAAAVTTPVAGGEEGPATGSDRIVPSSPDRSLRQEGGGNSTK